LAFVLVGMMMVVLSVGAVGCGKKGPPVPKNPYATQGAELLFHSQSNPRMPLGSFGRMLA
jgi:hypothetical protein